MPVLSEIATFTEATQGTSLARFGHGEFAVMNGMDANRQKYDPRLAEDLRAILRHSPCLVCVPHVHGKRSWEWTVFLQRYGTGVEPDRWYGSSFISRPDETEWPEAYKEFVSSFINGAMHFAPSGRDDYERIDEYEKEIIGRNPKCPVLLSCGPTASVLADRLCRKGIWAIDIGNMRAFL